MTEQEINDAITETVGVWRDYANDLNAMHEAMLWIKQNDVQAFIDYNEILIDIADGDMSDVHATAQQRSKAFLIAVGKWRD